MIEKRIQAIEHSKGHGSAATVPSKKEELYRLIKENLKGRCDFRHIYCSCFTSEGDDLSQWRAYADDGKGVAMGVDLNAVFQADIKHRTEIRPVCYDQNEVNWYLMRVLDQMSEMAVEGESGMLVAKFQTLAFIVFHAFMFKDPSFRSENEIRIVYQPEGLPTQEEMDLHRDELYDPARVEFQHKNGVLIPFVTTPLPKEAITKVMLGPRRGSNHEKDSMKLFLETNGIDPDVMDKSEISYRG